MSEIPLSQINKARNRCAEIIAQCGDRYLPLFERLENEIQIREENQRLLDKAQKIATQNATRFATQNSGKQNHQGK